MEAELALVYRYTLPNWLLNMDVDENEQSSLPECRGNTKTLVVRRSLTIEGYLK